MNQRSRVGNLFFLAWILPCVCPALVSAQTADFTFNRLDQAHLDSLAALTAKKIREATKAPKETKILVMDFFRNSAGTSTQLGTFLADRFSESLAIYSAGVQIIDRKVVRDFLVENWTTLDDLNSNEICFAVAQQLGATGMIFGTLAEKSGNIELTLHLQGFGPAEKEDDLFAWRDRTLSFSMTDQLRSMLFQPGPDYSRKAQEIPKEPGVFLAGVSGATSPQCESCPPAETTDLARAAKFHATVVLSVVVTAQGKATDFIVLKGAPFGLTRQVISATKNWRFRPGEKDGKPISVRVPVEATFRFY